MQWGLNKVILGQHQWKRDRGWLQFWAQEEAAKLWVREGVQEQGIACLLACQGARTKCSTGGARGTGGSGQREAGAAVDTVVEGGGGSPRAGRVEERGPTRGCSAAYPGTDGTTNAGAQRYATASRKLTTAKPDLARDLLELQHRRPGFKRRRSPQNNEQFEPELRFGSHGIGDSRERGARGHTSEFPRSKPSQTTHKQGPKRGSTAARTADADTKQWRQKTAGGPPTPNPGRKAGVEGRDWRWRRIGNFRCNAYTVGRTPTVHWTR